MRQSDNLPRHVGIIMDGNRRWARAHGLPTLEGHLTGYQNLRQISLHLLERKQLPYLSVYVFSAENWSRSKTEVSYLMRLVRQALDEFLAECQDKNIRLVVLGRRQKLSRSVSAAIDKAEATTINNKAGTLALCFNYGGHDEVVDAANQLAAEKRLITTDALARRLYHPEVPPVDLIIRTSGEQRLSGFMLWRSAYAELYFVDKHWPDFSEADADAALADYASRQRRFGV